MVYIQLLVLIEKITHSARVPFAALTLAFCLYCFISVIRSGDHGPEETLKKYLPWLAAAALAAVILRVILYPHHAGLMDDDYYHIQNARRMMDPSFVPFNGFEKSPGWPLIISILLWFSGLNEYVVFFANSIIGCLSVIILFYLVMRLTDNMTAGIAAAAILAFHPLHCMWSVCGENNVAAIFFMLLSLFALISFIRFHKAFHIYLSLFAASYAVQIRSDNILLFVFIPIGLYVMGREIFDIKRLAKGILIPFLLAVPNLLYDLMLITTKNWTQSDTGGIASGKNLSVDNLLYNLSTEISRVTQTGDYSFVILIIAAAGLFFGWKKENKKIVFFSVLGAAYFILLSMLWKTHAYPERFFLYTDMCLIIVGSLFVKDMVERAPRSRNIILVLCLVVPAVFSQKYHIRNINPDYSYFYYGKGVTNAIARIKKELPEKSILIVQDPSPFQAVTDIPVMTPEIAIPQAENLKAFKNLYFFMDISSNITPKIFYEIFELEKVFSVPTEPNMPPDKAVFGLYRITGIDTKQPPVPEAGNK